eukprot:8342787-Pyramimonas_sp.AAC.1
MHTERLLSLIGAAAGPVKPPTLERYLADGLLTQFVAEHTAAGGADPRAETRDLLERSGIVTASAAED